MAFIRSPEPFREPPPRRPHGPLVIGIVVLLVFFVPLIVVTALNARTPSPGSPATGSSAAASAGGTADPVSPLPAQQPPAEAPLPPQQQQPPPPHLRPRPGAVPPPPPPGAPWPPPPGAPQPPVCTLAYAVQPDGSTLWTEMTTLAGELSVQSGPGRSTDRYDTHVAAAVTGIRLPEPLAQDHRLRAVLTTARSGSYTCVVGASV
ncbi:hypothetical protein GXW83_32280 [Streptacidiphilus sp. PB12-B1b]|uniref:hypothetical protein n=1 Tax=Streptacidiphilus sp. PB12-B1b TaxID=2705012 RepID=UPI0015FB3643|nr:hypothetical protein [Streptacidiphilus sp. PB12-B1b]QMU79687.1 hypothetical protein GXW83_32280 [Streptacidiphilus sp. PB12-B1b]